ncbi:MAG: NADH-quinone oxidoreductase subunit C [Chloroflexi bacterium]|nr:NADH-quinone oxidoreductase subunit C [Chloroflexota bacterium]
MAATTRIGGAQLAERIEAGVPAAVEETTEDWVLVRPERLVDVMTFLRDDRELDARYLNALSGVDYFDYFEIVYHLSSLSHNHEMTVKVKADHDEPEAPSVASVWQGAHLQEREIYDLLGVRFSGHPNMKRIFLWEGFPGHPLRKDYMALPGGQSPGLRRFPKEDPEQWGGEFRGD